MPQNEQSIKESINLMDDAYRIIMDLIQGNDYLEDKDYLEGIQDILSSIDDVQNKIESLTEFETI
tara:strand:- start:76 stop:270 length:195 start_codon:yes stop_codon:yes gene_type:complete